MKIILLLSLILNGVLLYLYFEEKDQPPLERIIMEKHVERIPKAQSLAKPRPDKVTKSISKEKTPDEDAQFPLVGDQVTFERSVDDMEMVKKDFFFKNEIPEKFEIQKAEILGDYYKMSSAVYSKHPAGMSMSFDEKHKLIDMEEKAHKKIEKLFGKEKWSKYKIFVDSYNKKLIEGYKSGDYTGPLMGY
jgi:hypothetical protein